MEKEANHFTDSSKTRQGYRYFECECGNKWKSKSRDCSSPSVEDCEECFEFCFPYSYEVDENMKVDIWGNLI